VYIEVINHATDSTRAVRRAIVSGSRRRSAPLANPGAAVHGTVRDSIHTMTSSPA
jgi:hypothetical protein